MVDQGKLLKVKGDGVTVHEYIAEIQEQLDEQRKKREQIELQARSKATNKIRFGLACAFGQTGGMGIGIFVVSSWDVFEPLSFLVTAFWLMIGSKLWLLKGVDMTIDVYEQLYEQELEKLYESSDFDLHKEQFLEDYLEELKTYAGYLEPVETIKEE